MTDDLNLRQRVADLYAAYASCIDDERFDEWPELFTEDGWYRVVSRENFDRDLPLSTLSLKGRGMMKDRIYGVTSTIFHAPYYQRHIIGIPKFTSTASDSISSEVNYVVFRTKRDSSADIFSVGRYIDIIDISDSTLKFKQKFCIFDNDLIPNSLIYPI